MKSALIRLSNSRFRWFLILPMTTQMTLMMWLAVEGRPDTGIKAPDWLLHFIAYALLMVFAWIACHAAIPRHRRGKHLIIATSLAILFGLIDEAVQSTSPVRCCDPVDFFADTAGALFGLMILLSYIRFKNFKKEYGV